MQVRITQPIRCITSLALPLLTNCSPLAGNMFQKAAAEGKRRAIFLITGTGFLLGCGEEVYCSYHQRVSKVVVFLIALDDIGHRLTIRGL